MAPASDNTFHYIGKNQYWNLGRFELIASRLTKQPLKRFNLKTKKKLEKINFAILMFRTEIDAFIGAANICDSVKSVAQQTTYKMNFLTRLPLSKRYGNQAYTYSILFRISMLPNDCLIYLYKITVRSATSLPYGMYGFPGKN
jgi:hypothetical protein